VRPPFLFGLILGKLTEPVVHPQVGDTVPDQEVEPAILGADEVQTKTGEEQTKVTQGNQLGILGLVQRTGGAEVVDTAKPAVALALTATFGLPLVVVVAGDVDKEVHGPAEQLLKEEVRGSEDGSLLHELAELVHGLADTRSVLLTGLGDENHVAGKITRGLVVLAMGDLPREVRDHQERVADPADAVVQDLGRRERLVTALVSQHPDTGTEETLDNCVQSPEDDTSWERGNRLRGDIVVGEVEDGSQAGHVAKDIVQTGDGGAVEAVSGNSIADLLDCEVGDPELVAIGVQQLNPLLLRSHGGQRGGGGRLARAIKGRC